MTANTALIYGHKPAINLQLADTLRMLMTLRATRALYSPVTIIRLAPILAESFISQAHSLFTVRVSVAYHISNRS